MYKIAAIDLDGTMLNKYGAVTDETKSAIKELHKKGIITKMFTGDSKEIAEKIAKEIKEKNSTKLIVESVKNIIINGEQ